MDKSFNNSRTRDRGTRDRRFRICRKDQIRCLMSQVRQEIVDVVEALGTCSIGEIAEQLGRSADGLYYHVKALVKVDLLEERGVRPGGRIFTVLSHQQGGRLGERLLTDRKDQPRDDRQ